MGEVSGKDFVFPVIVITPNMDKAAQTPKSQSEQRKIQHLENLRKVEKYKQSLGLPPAERK
jgi:hypothetical protein